MLILLAIGQPSPAAAEPPEIPVGSDAYRQWDKRPLQRIGCRAGTMRFACA